MKFPISRVMLKNDCPVQTLRGSPQGQHTEHHHVATFTKEGKPVLSITYDDASGLIYFEGWGEKRAAHVSSVREMDFAVVPAVPPGPPLAVGDRIPPVKHG